MADENKLFNELAEVKPPRKEVGIPPDEEAIGNDNGGGSLSQRMRGSPKKTDTQVVIEYLLPELKTPWLSNLMMARVFPETFNPLRNIIAKHLLQEYNEMSVAEALAQAEVALTIPLDGEGRLDIIHTFSKLSGTDTEENKNKGM